jgi:hypothetical protein
MSWGAVRHTRAERVLRGSGFVNPVTCDVVSLDSNARDFPQAIENGFWNLMHTMYALTS